MNLQSRLYKIPPPTENFSSVLQVFIREGGGFFVTLNFNALCSLYINLIYKRMKKLLSFVMLLLMVVGGAKAWTPDTSKWYKLSIWEGSTKLGYLSTDGVSSGSNLVYADDATVFQFTASGSGYTIKDAEGYYIYATGWNAVKSSSSTVWTIADNGDYVNFSQTSAQFTGMLGADSGKNKLYCNKGTSNNVNFKYEEMVVTSHYSVVINNPTGKSGGNIEIGGTTYTGGENFDYEGVLSKSDITINCPWSGYKGTATIATTSTDNYTITVTYLPHFVPEADATYLLKDVGYGLFVTVGSGAKMVQYGAEGTQLIFTEDSNGYFTIKNEAGDYAGKGSNSWDFGSTSATAWDVEYVDVDAGTVRMKNPSTSKYWKCDSGVAGSCLYYDGALSAARTFQIIKYSEDMVNTANLESQLLVANTMAIGDLPLVNFTGKTAEEWADCVAAAQNALNASDKTQATVDAATAQLENDIASLTRVEVPSGKYYRLKNVSTGTYLNLDASASLTEEGEPLVFTKASNGFTVADLNGYVLGYVASSWGDISTSDNQVDFTIENVSTTTIAFCASHLGGSNDCLGLDGGSGSPCYRRHANQEDAVWTLEEVAVETADWTVEITGAPSEAKVTYNAVEYANGATIENVVGTPSSNQFSATAISGYESEITVNATDKKIVVTYTENNIYPFDVTAASQFDGSFVATFTTSRGALTANADSQVQSDKVYTSGTENDKKFAVLTIDGAYRFYNIATKKFMTRTSSSVAGLVEGETTAWDFVAQSDGTLLIKVKDEAIYFNFGGSNQVAINDWGTADAGNKFTVVAVEAFSDADRTEAEDIYYNVGGKLDKVDAIIAAIGTGLGQYTSSFKVSVDAMTTLATDARTAYEGGTFDTFLSSYSIPLQAMGYAATKAGFVSLCNDFLAATTINQPETGKFYRVKGGVTGKYAAMAAENAQMTMISDADESTIFYLDDQNRFIGYKLGLGLVNTYWVATVGETKETVTFTESQYNFGKYCLTSNFTGSKIWYDNGNHETPKVDRNSAENSVNCSWDLEEVTELPLTLTKVNDVNYSTLYLPVAATLSAGEAYVAQVSPGGNPNQLHMELVSGTIPANTGVVIASTEGTATITLTDDVTPIEGSLLTGKLALETTDDEAVRVFSKRTGADAVGFYKLPSTTTTLKAFRAFYETTNSSIDAFELEWEGTTGIIANMLNKKAVEGVYDLQGRKVNNAGRGLYIINGKKVIK